MATSTVGAADLVAALTGGGQIENAAYAQQANRILDAQNKRAMLDQNVQKAFMAARQNKGQEGFGRQFAALMTGRENPNTPFTENELAALVPQMLAANGYNFTDSTSGLDKLVQTLQRTAIQQGAADEGMTPVNQAALAFSPKTVPSIEEVGDLLVRGNLTANPEVDQALTAMNSAANAASDHSGSQGVRGQKIADLMRLHNLSEPDAVSVVDGYKKMEISPYTGKIILSDRVSGTASEVPLDGGTSEMPVPDPSGSNGLYQIAADATGLGPSFQDLSARATSLLGANPDMGATEAIQSINTAKNEMIRALSINPRFPVGEIQRLSEEINIKPGWFTSDETMRSRMRSIDESLRLRLAQAERDANDPTLSRDIRQSQSDNAVSIRNFLAQLNVPQGGPQQAELPPDQMQQAMEAARQTYPGFDELSPTDQMTIIQADLAEQGAY